MSNPHRGTYTFKVGDKAYTLIFNHHCFCVAEAELKRPYLEIMTELVMGAHASKMIWATTIGAVLWAALQEKHPGLTLRDASRIVDEAGEGPTVAALLEAFALCRPPPEEGSANPR